MTETSFTLALDMHGELDRCQQVVRQALWWQGASVESYTQDLNFSESSKACLLKETKSQGDDGRVLVVFGKLAACFSAIGGLVAAATDQDSCNMLFSLALDDAGASESEDGWRTLTTADGGELSVHVAEDPKSWRGDLNTVSLKRVTPEVVRFLYRLLVQGGLVLFPALITATVDAVDKLRQQRPEDEHNPYPPFDVISSEDEL